MLPCQPLALFIDTAGRFDSDFTLNHNPSFDLWDRRGVEMDVGFRVVVGVATTDAENDRVA